MAWRKNDPNLTNDPAYLEPKVNELDRQLAEKATKEEVDSKRDKSVLLNQYDLTDELKQQITGNAPVLNVVADGIVSPLKTTFINRGKNLFDKTKATDGYYVNGTGGLSANSDFYASDYIFVKPSTTYTKSDTWWYAFYDANKVFISAVTTPGENTFTTPSGCYYIRASGSKTRKSIDAYQVEEGSVQTAYESYYESFNTSYLKDKTIDNNKLIIPVAKSNDAWRNVLKNADGSEGTSYWTTAGSATLSVSGGVFSWLADVQYRNVNQKVNIQAGQNFRFEVEINAVSGATLTLQPAFYQTNGTFISQNPVSISATGDWKKFSIEVTAPDLTGYVNMGISDIRASGRTTVQFRKPILIIVDNLTTDEKKINLDKLGGFWTNDPKFGSYSVFSAQSKTVVTQWTDKKMLSIGDSWTEANKWQPIVVSNHGINSYTNPAIGGTQIGVFMDNVSNIDADLVTIMGCLNNYAGATPIGTIADAPNRTGSVFAQAKYIIDKIYTLKPSVKIAWISATNPGTAAPYYPGWNQPNSIGKTYKDYVDAMREVCEYYSIPFLDLFKLAGINQYTIDQWSNDQVHPNDKGYEVVGRMIAEFIKGI